MSKGSVFASGGGRGRSMRDLEHAGIVWLASSQDRVCLSSLIVYVQLLLYHARARSHESMPNDLQTIAEHIHIVLPEC
jgi:hypothetical protein